MLVEGPKIAFGVPGGQGVASSNLVSPTKAGLFKPRASKKLENKSVNADRK
jgi:hypothetical protein